MKLPGFGDILSAAMDAADDGQPHWGPADIRAMRRDHGLPPYPRMRLARRDHALTPLPAVAPRLAGRGTLSKEVAR